MQEDPELDPRMRELAELHERINDLTRALDESPAIAQDQDTITAELERLRVREAELERQLSEEGVDRDR